MCAYMSVNARMVFLDKCLLFINTLIIIIMVE